MNSSFKIFPHLVEESPWPLYVSVGALCLTAGGVVHWHFGSVVLLLIGFFMTMFFSYSWWSDVMYENSAGLHNSGVIHGLRLGMILFILSEMMFFFSFFWAFFGKCFNPDSELGYLWPPLMFDFMIMDPFAIPLLKSVLLLSSGASVTAAHHYMLNGKYFLSNNLLLLTILLGVVFLGLQVFEYAHSLISVNSTIYGSTFFLLTGFHGLHVTMGVMFLFVCYLRALKSNISSFNHTGFEAASWYWHFVDVVWLFLYFFVYWYGFRC